MRKLIVIFMLAMTFAMHSMDLFKACECGDVARVKDFIAQGVDLNSKNPDGSIALHMAVQKGHVDLVKLLLDRGASVRVTNQSGYTALYTAVLYKHDALINLLLEKDTIINPTFTDGSTPLHIAAFNGHIDVVRFLLDHNIGIDFPMQDGSTALHNAAFNGHINVIRFLLERGVSINVTDQKGYTALHEAAFNKHDDVVQLLLERGASINAVMPNGVSTLHTAAVNGHINVVKFLLDHNIAVDSPLPDRYTALYYAAHKGHVDVARLLLDRGASINAIMPNGVSILHTAAFNGHVDMVRLLLERGASINVTDQNGYTALHEAVFNKHDDVVRLLLERGASINVVAANGSTALHTAAFNGHINIVRFLLDHNIAVDSPSPDRYTALYYAAHKGHIDVARLLLDRGASINAVAANGSTALHTAAINGYVDMVRLLLERAGDIDSFKGSKKIEHIKNLKKTANLLYLQNLWANGLIKISFLQRQLEEFNWQHGTISAFEVVNDVTEQEVDHFCRPGVMLITMQNAMAAELILSQCLLHNPFKLSRSDIQLVDEYIQMPDEEVKLVASALKQQYIIKEMDRQFEYLYNLIKKEIIVSGMPCSQYSCVSSAIDNVTRSFQLIEQIKRAHGAQSLVKQGSFNQFADILAFITDSHVGLEALYRFICSEIKAVTLSAGNYNISGTFAARTLPDSISLMCPMTTFEEYFAREELQDDLELAVERAASVEPEAAPSSECWTTQAQARAEKVVQEQKKCKERLDRRRQDKKIRHQMVQQQQSKISHCEQAAHVEQVTSSVAPSPASPKLPVTPRISCAAKKVWHNPLQNYAMRVNRWFRPRWVQNLDKKDVLYHSFSRLADTFIMRSGIQTQWRNRTCEGKVDTSYSLPGMVIFSDGMKRDAVFTCTLDAQGCCYHRGITYKQGTELIREFSGAGIELDHHDIETRQTVEKVEDVPAASGTTTDSLEKNKMTIKIYDSYNKVNIILYRLPKTSEQMH